jgi:hypothetical protein
MPKRIVWVFALLLTSDLWAGQATISWNRNPEPYVTGYRIHYGTSSRKYTSVIDVGNVTRYVVRRLAPGKWYFAVSAYTFEGRESGLSEEMSKTIPSHTGRSSSATGANDRKPGRALPHAAAPRPAP